MTPSPHSLAQYDVTYEDVSVVPGLSLRIARVRDVNALVDAITELDEDERLPYWASLWPSAIALARHLATSGRNTGRVIELGAGLGLPSLAAAKLGFEVLATDYEPDALRFLEENAALNETSVRTELMDMRAPSRAERFTLILASDLLYEARQVVPLSRAVHELLAPGGTLMLSDPQRPHLTTFRHEMSELGFQSTEYPRPEAMVVEFERST
jgi:predicted nicotinamide N-methyase